MAERDATLIEPRGYQLELVQYVSQRNAIIYLPTGSGKTYVAILALKRYSQQMQETVTNGGKRAIFMCNTVELARQQAVEIRKNTNLKVGYYVGEREVDSWSRKKWDEEICENQVEDYEREVSGWSRQKWDEEIAENQVLVGTAQIFLDIVSQSYLQISDLSVVIIDECHHATKSHPMHEFMRLFQYVDNCNQLPRVIGLTGVLLKGSKLTNIEMELNNLEATFRGNIITVSSMEQFNNVMLYSTKPTEELVRYPSERAYFEVEGQIATIINECCNIVDKWDLGNIPTKLTKGLAKIREPSKKNFIKNMLKDFLYQMEDFGVFTASIAIMSPLIEFELKKRQAETLSLRYLYRYIISKCEFIRHLLTKKLDEFLDGKGENTMNVTDSNNIDLILNFSTPKLRSLLIYMKSVFEKKKPNDICCLIFVQRRYSAKCLCYVVQRYVESTPELSKVIRADFMVGRNNVAQGVETILDRKWNKHKIDSFRSGKYNVIICSSVLEEGIDVQACNYVFAFDPLRTFNSYIQTKGRARTTGASYVIFTPKHDSGKTVQQINKYQQIHEMIKTYLIGRILDREDPRENDIANQFVDMIEPFVVPSGARLLPSSSLSILYRYCQLLPSDAFGVLTPWFTKLPPDDDGKCLVSATLPLQSIVKETVISDPMETTKMAKMSVAFKLCKKLYEHGELNEKLLPTTKRECVAKVSDELFQHWRKYNEDVSLGSPGKQHHRTYDRMCPEELFNSMPIVGETCYAYEIKFKPQFELNEYNAYVLNLLRVPTNYAILLSKKLPRLAEMPLFMNQGQINIQICAEPIEFRIKDEETLKLLRKYHTMIFRDILEDCWHKFFVVDHRNKENAFLVAPIRDGNIDWQMVRQFQRMPKSRKYTTSERAQMRFRPEDFIGKIVAKWYSNIECERFVVTKVCTNLTPMSDFSDERYENYANFVISKYASEVDYIAQPDQFLLEVQQITPRRNFFVNSRGKTSEVVKKRSSLKLIPELCHNYLYPGDMWMKALFLPCILYRLHFMLHAETLRKRINTFLGIDTLGPSSSVYEPKPLIIDTSLRRAVDVDGNAMEQQQEPKKLLPIIPPKQSQTHMDVQLLSSNEGIWKDFIEPIDHTRNPFNIYPIEVDYYYKFVAGLLLEMEALSLNDEDEWSKSQLTISTPHSQIIGQSNKTRPSIMDAVLEDRRRIDILERTLGNVEITTAEQYEVVAALTTSGANDVFDMERFELLGDAFLKFSISLYLVNKYPKFNEGFLTEIKSKLVSNRNLLYCMFEQDIPKRICASLFKPKSDWLPPNFSLPNNIIDLMQSNKILVKNVLPGNIYTLNLNEEEIESGNCTNCNLTKFISCCNKNKHHASGDTDLDAQSDINVYIYKEVMSDKVVADTLEAILGVCVKNYGAHQAFRMLEFFGICKPDPDMPLSNLLDLKLGSPLLRTNITSNEVDGFLINYKNLEENLGYQFRDRAYLLQALTHPSFPTNRLTGCYQELEFIGDAILDFMVSCYIFERNKTMTPGMLTDLRSALVNNITLGCVCVRHRFHLYLLFENSSLAESIKTFADFQETQGHRVTAQTKILCEEEYNTNEVTKKNQNLSYNMSVIVDVPKALGDIVEALIAAVYLDSRDLKVTWHVIHRLLEQELIEFSYNVPKDPVRQLYEHKHASPKFSDAIVEEDVVMVKCSFTCLDKEIEVNGFGCNSKQARKSAAKHALQILAKYSS